MKLTIATCQFSTSGDIIKNCKNMVRQIKAARTKGANVAHFGETALTGYPNYEIPDLKSLDWNQLIECSQEIMQTANNHKIWVIFASVHKLTGKHKPHNSLYIINDKGRLIDRYDKMFCTGDPTNQFATGDDLTHFSPGNHFSVFKISGIHCGALICHDMRYSELYRQYCRQGVRLMFHSYYLNSPQILYTRIAA